MTWFPKRKDTEEKNQPIQRKEKNEYNLQLEEERKRKPAIKCKNINDVI